MEQVHPKLTATLVASLIEDSVNRYNANRDLIEEKFTTAYIQKMINQLHKMTRTKQYTHAKYQDHLWNAYVIAYWPPQTLQRAITNSYGTIAWKNDWEDALHGNEHAYTGDNYDG